MVVTCGGFTGGYTLFVKNDRLYLGYDISVGVHYVIEPPLAKGEEAERSAAEAARVEGNCTFSFTRNRPTSRHVGET